MAVVYLKLTTAFAGWTPGTIVQSDDTLPAVQNLLNADYATAVTNPGGTLPVYAPTTQLDDLDGGIAAEAGQAGAARAALDARYARTGATLTATGGATVAPAAQAATATPGAGGVTADAGTVTATALATGMAAGPVATIAFTTPYGAVPHAILLSETSAAAVGLYVSARTTGGFTVSARTAPTASQALAFDYAVIG